MSRDVLEELSEELRSLTMEELSKVTTLPTWRLREMVKQGKGPPHFRVGTTYRFPVTGVRKWNAELTSCTKEAARQGPTQRLDATRPQLLRLRALIELRPVVSKASAGG